MTRSAVADPEPHTSSPLRLRLFLANVGVAQQEGLSVVFQERVEPAVTFVGGGKEGDEDRARVLLERMGAIDMQCLEETVHTLSDHVDFLVRLDGTEADYCKFSRDALPVLQEAGFQVDVDTGYPYTARDPEWQVEIAADPSRRQWFRLGMTLESEHGGARLDLLEALLDLLRDARENEPLGEFIKRASSCRALAIGDNERVLLSSDRLRSVLLVLFELYQGNFKNKTASFPLARAAILADLELYVRARGIAATFRDPHGLLRRGRMLAEASPLPSSSEPSSPPKELRATLRSYQSEGVAFLGRLRALGAGGILADDMGLGKTLQTIAHLCGDRERGGLRHPALIVAPTSLLGNWRREFEKFAPHVRVHVHAGSQRKRSAHLLRTAEVVVTSYPLAVRDEPLLRPIHYSSLILDEAQTIKSIRSLASKALRTLDAEHRIGLTGTPIENSLFDLWALMDFLAPNLLGDELSFRRVFQKPIANGDRECERALRRIVAPFILRREKRDVAPELPKKTELWVPIEMDKAQADLYEGVRLASHAAVRKLILEKGLARSTVPILSAVLRLRQVCCDPRLLPMDVSRGVQDSAKFAACMAMVKEQVAQGHRILIFSQFTSMLTLLAEGLEKEDIGFVVLTGSTSDRQAMVDAFEKGLVPVFLISLKAGGTGLNLTSADTVIHYDPWWNPAAQAQATDRAYRIGQTKPVFVFHLYVAATVEERVLDLQRTKRHLSDVVLGVPTSLSESDIDTLFAPADAAAMDLEP